VVTAQGIVSPELEYRTAPKAEKSRGEKNKIGGGVKPPGRGKVPGNVRALNERYWKA